MVDGFLLEDLTDFNEIENACRSFHQGLYENVLATDKACERMWVFPNEMPDELCAKLCPTYILTTEFDMYKRGAERAAEKYKRCGSLAEYGCLAGVHHGHYYDFAQKRTPEYFRVMTKIANKHF